MRTYRRTIFVIFCLIFSCLTGFAAMKAGVASVVITPDEPIWMSGYASRNKPSEGKVQELYAKALALEDADGNRAVVVTTDLIGMTATLAERVHERFFVKTGLPRERLMLTSSHTHSGPVIRDNLETMYELSEEQWAVITRYTKTLEDRLVQVIEAALDDLQPATVLRGTGRAGFAVNRRVYTPNGVQFGENFIGLVDHDVPVMKVLDGEGKTKAVLFGYACHNTTMDFYQLCGDYAGYAQEAVEAENPGAVALFFSGCAGDANPTPRRELDHAKQHGRELGESVQKVIDEKMVAVDGTIKTAFSHVQLQLTPAPSRDELQKQLEDENKYIRLRAKSLLKTLDEEGKIAEAYPYPVQVWRIGEEFLFIALGGEVVVDYALLFKHKYGADDTWVAAYTNDVPAYIPSLRVLREGGYEGEHSMIYYGLHGPWAQNIEELVTNEVYRLVEETN